MPVGGMNTLSAARRGGGGQWCGPQHSTQHVKAQLSCIQRHVRQVEAHTKVLNMLE
jgi:hypothetical protein